jgi:hypothetical protein
VAIMVGKNAASIVFPRRSVARESSIGIVSLIIFRKPPWCPRTWSPPVHTASPPDPGPLTTDERAKVGFANAKW